MKRTILAVAVVTGLAHPKAAQAQIVVGPAHGGGVVFGRGLGFSYQRHNFRAFGFAGGVATRSFFAFPVAPVFPAVPPFGFGPGWAVGPPFGWNTGWGPGFWGPTWSWFVAPPPPVIVVPPPIILAGNLEPPERDLRGAVVIRPDDPPRPEPLKLLKKDDFVVVEPRKPALPPPGKIVPEIDRVAKLDRLPVLPPPGRLDPFAGPRRIDRDRPAPDPVKEAARMMALGRTAFALGEYGKAGERFDLAATADPKSAEARFLKAQAAYAAGAYTDAVTAIRAGLKLDPAWPTSPFDPKEPYGTDAAAFAAHLADLRKVVAANPREPTLEFLLGYQLWFVGERVEAKKWFAAAEPRLAGPEILSLFK